MEACSLFSPSGIHMCQNQTTSVPGFTWLESSGVQVQQTTTLSCQKHD